MDTTDLHATHQAAPRTGFLEHAVPPAMLVAAMAMGVAGHLHLGLSQELAAAVGLAMFCLMLLCHVLLRAADAADRAAEAEVERRIAQVPSPMPVPMPQQSMQHAAPEVLRAPPPLPPREALPSELDIGPPRVVPMEPVAAFSQSEPREETAPPHEMEKAPAAWAFRPIDIGVPVVEAAQAPAERVTPPLPEAFMPTLPAGTGDTGGDETGAAPQSREAERIDAILKRLAGQIRSAGQEPRRVAVSPAPVEPAPADFPATPAPVDAVSQPPDAPPFASLPETALNRAVDALRTTVEAMRASAPPIASRAPLTDAAALPPDAEVRLAAVAEALAAERANVFLEPILALDEDQARHFEVSVRLATADGEDLDARAIAAGAGGSGLLAVLDALSLKHAAGFAMKLERRGRDGAVFSAVAGRSLGSEQFVSDAAGRHAQGVADRLVLTFAQEEMRTLGPAQITALGDLGRLGFRFALQGVSDLDMDFESLRGLGVQFVKLDAQVFLQGLTCAGQTIPSSDICRHFEDLGLQVIVSGIDSARVRLRIEGCGVAFGQGTLFGPPRPIPVGNPAGGSIAA